MSDSLKRAISGWYEVADGNPAVEDYHARHGIESALILTVTEDERAADILAFVEDRIRGKVVVEIGAGIGLLACHLATVAKRVYAIEADPAWMSSFVHVLYRTKPKNLTYIFGTAEDAPHIAADVALFCTLSGRDAMYRAACAFAPEVIDVYGEVASQRDQVVPSGREAL